MTNNVKLTNQSFRDAGGLEVFPDLEMGEVLFSYGPSGSREKTLIEANENMKEIAEKLGYTHVFGMEYDRQISGHPSNDRFNCDARGTGYKPRNKLE